MTLPWYPRNMGEYARDTGHLTMLEHGAYNLLLDAYYSTGCLPRCSNATSNALPMPDHSRLYRLCSAITKAEQDAVDTVLSYFFHIDGSGEYKHTKCDEIIEKQEEKHRKRVEAGKKGGAKKGKQSSSNAKAKPKQSPTDKDKDKDISLPKGNESCHPHDVTYSTKDGRFMNWDGVVDYLWNDYPRVGRRIRHKDKFSQQLLKLLREEGNNADDWQRIIGDVAAAVRKFRHYCEETNEKPADPFRWLRDGGHKESLDYSQTADQTKHAGSGKGSSTTNQTITAAEKAKQALRGL